MRHTASFLQTFHTATTEADRLAASQSEEEATALAFLSGDDAPGKTTGVATSAPKLRTGEYMADFDGFSVKLSSGYSLISEKQAKWICGMLTWKDVPATLFDSIRVRLEQGLARRAASAIIEQLKALPARPKPTTAAMAEAIAPGASLEEIDRARGVTKADVPAGRYAVMENGELRFFHVELGKAGSRWEGFVFLSVKSSDETYPIRDRNRKAAVLATIAEGPEAAEILYATTLRQCRKCHRDLTDQKNPYLAVGYGPECGGKA